MNRELHRLIRTLKSLSPEDLAQVRGFISRLRHPPITANSETESTTAPGPRLADEPFTGPALSFPAGDIVTGTVARMNAFFVTDAAAAPLLADPDGDDDEIDILDGSDASADFPVLDDIQEAATVPGPASLTDARPSEGAAADPRDGKDAGLEPAPPQNAAPAQGTNDPDPSALWRRRPFQAIDDGDLQPIAALFREAVDSRAAARQRFGSR